MSDGQPWGRLGQPVRNRYFYGKLLDEAHLQLEQDYGNGKRWLINRLVLGWGVVNGLVVTPTPDGRTLRVGPGVAIDPFGREIVVPEPLGPVDPWQPTDGAGRATGPTLAGGTVTVGLAYREGAAEPVPVLAPTGDGESGSEPGVVRETGAVVVTVGGAERTGPACEPPLDAAFAAYANDDARNRFQRAAAQHVARPPADVATDGVVVLAQLDLPAAGVSLTPEVIDPTVRPVVFGNQMLAALALCLGRLAPVPGLEYVAGDGQTGPLDETLPQELAVRAVGSDGEPVAGVPLTFVVRAGGGTVAGEGSLTRDTGPDGVASVAWRTGHAPGLGTVAVSPADAAGRGPSITFVSLAASPNPSPA